MILLRKPTAEKIREFLANQARLDLTYSSVGATASVPPPGYASNHSRVQLGKGDSIFRAAQQALRDWRQFDLGWVEASPRETPIAIGQNVAVFAHTFGLWWLNACRIVRVVDEENRFGFAYGTLPAHVASGEEQFLIERNPQDGGVWYDIAAFSLPRQMLVRLGYPYMRIVQKRFGRDSAAAMQRALATFSPA